MIPGKKELLLGRKNRSGTGTTERSPYGREKKTNSALLIL
jgi:hypothetical protein